MLQEYKSILVAIDGSTQAEKAFKKAVEVAKRNNAQLVLAHVIDTRAYQSFSTFDGSIADNARVEAKNTLNEYKKYAEEKGLDNVKVVLEYGSPKVMIAKQIPQSENIDLIMLGATGLNAVERIFVGSVSEYVIRQAACDVMIVRTDLDNKLD
ncbi:universal stress protein [Alkalibacterium pelagium]|jgi:nucleotide-binding universal stress UspA family protein|uniref:Universal stress protein n=1 Tax=Alkalibacterium pelagium TaxID=426702 RepID=A0A1H7GQ39_9LACT|nr:universal stress protein [Alkalibacterium pelagium]GEN49731.1 universal stress protein [Alkalibacterium pelagium]SEK40191.1 Nucleotide-binding universal stress protein, UspA family [Alkalibacterium pelagium]